MATLTIDLQGGFREDAVECWVGGELRWRDDPVTTNLSIDLAASLPLEVPEGPVEVRLVLPARGLEERVTAVVEGRAHLAARVEGDALLLEQLAEAPRYL